MEMEYNLDDWDRSQDVERGQVQKIQRQNLKDQIIAKG